MPAFIRSALIWITGYGWIGLLLGLGFLGYAAYAQFKASDDHAYLARDKLTTLAGTVESVAEVTVTSKRRRGGSTRVSDRYYQADVKPASGELQKLRMPLSLGEQKASSIIGEPITALMDPDDSNIAYEIKVGSQTVLDYETTKTRLLAQAEGSAKAVGNLASIGGGILLALVGGLGVFLNRKLKQPAMAA